MKNENCLKGMMCPKCGHTEEFVIAAHTLVNVTDDGAEPTGGAMEWFDNSYCSCRSCGAVGSVSDFRIPGFSVTFDTVTPESAAEGDVERRGWWMPGEWLHDDKPDELAFEFDPDDFDPEEHDTLEDAIVEWAVGVLSNEGALHPNCSDVEHAEWWSTEGETLSYETGEEMTRSFHFEGFTDEQVARINQELSA